MAFVPPIILIRSKIIIKLLTKANAFCEENAKKLDEIGLINPYAFPGITKKMVEKKIITKTLDGKYYISKKI